MVKRKYKIAMLAPSPYYYQIPLFKKMAQSEVIEWMVYYCSDEAVKGIDVEKMYNTKSRFVEVDNLLKGYNYIFLKNYSFLPSFLSWPFGLMNFGIYNEIKNNKYDAVILQAWNNFTWWLAFFACLIFGTKVIFMTDASWLEEGLRTKTKKFFKKIFLNKLFFKKASGFFIVGKANKELYKAYGVPEEKMVDLHYHYGYEDFLAKAKELDSCKIKKKDFILLFVGRLAEDKNIFCLLDAFKKVNFKNKKLSIVGDGPLKEKIEQYIKNFNIDGVELFGFQARDSIFNFYNLSDALVLPSIDEPWGMVVNEAMCFGLPIIASDKVGAAVDLVKNSYNGFTFPAKDSGKLAEAIEKMANLPPSDFKNFRNRSLEIVNDWVKKLNPEEQIIKMMDKIL